MVDSTHSPQRPPTFIQAGTLVALVVTTVLGAYQGILDQPLAKAALVLAVVTVTLGIATAGLYWAERRPDTRALHAVLAAYAAGALLTIWGL